MNNILKYCFAAVTCLIMTNIVAAQPQVDTQVRIVDQRVKSLKVAPLSNMYLPPVVMLNSDDRIGVNFDLLDYDVHYLRYSVTHCNANWQPSALVESEYVEGFNQADIEDYEQSEGTFTHYFNYNFSIPNEDFRLTKSGNYLLTVYEQDDPNEVLFQTRFSLCENTVGVYASVTSRTDVDYNEAHQQVSIDVTYRSGAIADPYRELTTVIGQNTRTDNEVTLTAPMMVGHDRVTYDHQTGLIFEAGNEYRRIETVNTRSLNMGVAGALEYFEPYYHATLYTDVPRAEEQYLYDSTQHGHFTIRNAEADDSSIQADYVVTHFTLDCNGPVSGGNIFLDGEFVQGLPATQRLMRYDMGTGLYGCELLLKQGAYNYQYLFVPDGAQVGHTALIEGDKYQTTNQYAVKVYDRPVGERYDHLVGFGMITAGK